MDKLDHLGWVAQRSFVVGDTIFGVRATSRRFCEWLDHTLGAYRTDEETDPYFSVVVASQEGERRAKGYNILYRSTQKVVRTLHLPTVGRALIAEIESLSFHQRTDAVYVDFGLLASDGRTALVPSALGWTLAGLGRRVDRAGLRLPASAAVALDVGSGSVIPMPSTLGVSLDAFLELGSGRGAEPDRLLVENPLVPDLVWVYTGEQTPVKTVSRGRALAGLAGSVYNLKEMGGSALEALTRTVESSACYGIGSVDARGALEVLTTTFRSM